MKTIWKYSVQLDDRFAVSMPAGAKVLAVQTQFGSPVVWALVNPGAERVERKFRLVGTGHEIELSGYLYVGTFQTPFGLVFHLFVEEEK